MPAASVARLGAEYRRMAGKPFGGSSLAGADIERDGTLLAFNADGGRPVDVSVYPRGSHVLAGTHGIHGFKTTVSWEANRRVLWH